MRNKKGQRGFEILSRRRVVKRTFGSTTECLRLYLGYEHLSLISETMVKWAAVGLMTCRLAPSGGKP